MGGWLPALSYPSMNPERKQAYQRCLEDRLPGTLSLLEQLVAVNSHSRARSGLLENARLVAGAFEPLGFTARQVADADPERGDHLFLVRRGEGPQSIALVSHLDTVYTAEQEAANDFRWREEGSRIYGPGVADIKGGTALIHLVLTALAAVDREFFERISWHVLLNAAEEEGNLQFPELARAALPPGLAACLVYEPGNPDPHDPAGSRVTRSRRGSARFLVETIGREAHAGSGHRQGANAIRQLARVIERIEAMTDHARGLTFNVGIVGGGVASNTVPGRAFAQVDTRAETPADQQQQIQQLLALAGVGDVVSIDQPFPCRIVVQRHSCYPPWPESATSMALARTAEAAAASLGQRVVAEHRAGASDANHLWNVAPTLCSLGPVGRNIHCSVHDPEHGLTQESIDRTTIVPRALLSVALLYRLLPAP